MVKPTIDEYLFYYEYIKGKCKLGEYNLLLHRHLGDSFVIMGMYNEFVDKYQKPLHLLIGSNQEVLAWMYGIKNYTVIDTKRLLENEKLNIQYDKKNIDKFTEDLFEKLFPSVPQLDLPFIASPCSWVKENLGWTNFVDGWGKMLGLDCKKIIPPTRSPEISDTLMEKINQIAPIEKIVLIAPEAQSFSGLPLEFWEKIVRNLRSKGYQIIVNSMDKEFVLQDTYKLDMSVSDLIALGLKCHAVYSLRSGLCDCLVIRQSQLHVYYTREMWYKYLSLNECFVLEQPVNEYVVSDIEHITKLKLSELKTKFIQHLQKKKRRKTIINPLNMADITSADISVVVQGAIAEGVTQKCLRSIREQLPNCEIILSTWQGADITGLEYDKIILNKDPGARYFDVMGKIYNNCNRQLLSTQAGLDVASRKYILKFRTDFVLENTEFLKYWNEFKLRNREFAFFEHRVLADTIFTRFASDITGYAMPFHVSDFWMFGLANDVREYFCHTDLMAEADLGEYDHLYPYKRPYPQMTFRYAPEQYYCYSFAKRFLPELEFDDWTDWNTKNIELSDKILFNNFIFLSFEQSGIWSDKHASALLQGNNMYGIINFYYYQEQYKNYCDPLYACRKVYTVENSALYRLFVCFFQFLYKFVKILYRFIIKIVIVFKWIMHGIKRFACFILLKRQLIIKI